MRPSTASSYTARRHQPPVRVDPARYPSGVAVPPRPRLDSRLEAEGAEFLVLGYLLLEGINAHKTYTRYPGFDLIASNPATGRSCRIQVKSRWASDYDRTFPLK